MTADAPPPIAAQSWHVDVDGLDVELPIVPLGPDFAISLMMVIDLGVTFGTFVGTRLADRLRPLKPDVVVGAATLGIPIAIEVSRALGLDQYVILQKSPKVHLGDALVQTISSITSKGEQKLLLDRRMIPLLAGRRVVVVDDVVASGSSLKGSIDLVRRAGGEVIGAGVILTEARAWQAVLGEDAALIRSLGHIPQFEAKAGSWQPIPDSFL
ncbi:adenine phosphoribosyltransferase [Ancylobacter sonchi]|uniref:phosphoribosyltransferase family protein n=1 Tax=Ancylobacter sonchi TaxID=1937790 RepID=UPI001BD57E13|nr:phosphoribosyltransferase family protein [Ancylobacter sonchi]MBS7534324.1 adenine phosphoribosyltransferase [Ancylobacter sonchi]